MIAYIEGKLTHKSPAVVHLETNGLGYEVQITLNTYSRIQALERVKLYTHLHIREDAHILYGFFDPAEKQVFVELLGVSGIGAATARMILSSMAPDEVHRVVLREDEKSLEKIKGVGNKTAKRIILELKDKIARHKDAERISSLTGNTMQDDALNALIALGIARHAAEAAVNKVMVSAPQIHSLEELIKLALKTI